MPMIFKDSDVLEFLELTGCDTSGTADERRKRAANKSIEMGDPLQAWEISTGRTWNTMSGEEAVKLIIRHPEMANNPGVLSRLT